jgi:GGDEF domain-containing protein
VTASSDPFQTVFEVGATLIASLDLDQVFASIARQVGEALDVQWCDINEYDAVANTMTYVAVWSEKLRDEDLEYLGTVVSLDERPERDAVIRSGDVVVAYLDDPDLDLMEREVMEQYDEWATMEVPLVYGDEVIGVLGVVESRRSRRFSDEEMELLRLLAQPAAVAIGNARAYRGQRDRAQRTAALLDSSRVVAGTTDVREVLSRVAQLAVEGVDASQSAIYEYHSATDTIVYSTMYERDLAPDAEPDDELGTAYPLRDYPGERAIIDGGKIVLERRSDPDLTADRRASMDAWGEQTCLSVPLRFGGTPIGILRLYDMQQERLFGTLDLEMLEGLGELASAAIHNARLYQEQRHHSQRLLGLFETSRALASTFDLATIVDVVEDGARRLLSDCPAVAVWLRADDGGMKPAASVLSPAAAAPAAEPGRVAQEALLGLLPTQYAGDGASELAVPFIAKGQAEGFLLVSVRDRRVFAGSEIEALQVLSSQVAAAVENVRLYRRVEQEAIHDGLTGLYNHRYFQERLQQECALAQRYGLPLSLLMLDLDDFKVFNDTYGHQLGDEVLREVGALLMASVRGNIDLAARYGGEEFAVILPHTVADGSEAGESGTAVSADGEPLPPAGVGAVVVAERLRRGIEERCFAGHGGRRYARITVTLGVASYGQPSARPDELVNDADKALYAGKRAGKNRIEVFAP